MKLYIKQKVFSFADQFRIMDAFGNDRYYVEGEFFTIGKKLHLMDLYGNELCFIHQKVLSFLSRYYVSRGGQDVAEVVKKFTLFRQEYEVIGPGWQVDGDFLAHEYTIRNQDGRTVASISKKWMTFGDTYEIDIAPGQEELLVLSIVLIIDAVLAEAAAAASSAH